MPRRASKALALRPSMPTEIPTESRMASATPTHSANSVWPSESRWATFTPTIISNAITSNRIIGSLKASMIRLNHPICSGRDSLFAPCASRLARTASSVSPCRRSPPNSRTTSSAGVMNALSISLSVR